jgi:hypothetical protein
MSQLANDWVSISADRLHEPKSSLSGARVGYARCLESPNEEVPTAHQDAARVGVTVLHVSRLVAKLGGK